LLAGKTDEFGFLTEDGKTVTHSKNAAQIRATDTTLAAIARFKPKHCDCSCGAEAEGSPGRSPH
jgi:hypothetical protein